MQNLPLLVLISNILMAVMVTYVATSTYFRRYNSTFCSSSPSVWIYLSICLRRS